MGHAIVDLDLNTNSILIDSMTEHDWIAVRRIYAEGMAMGNATFEATTPDWEKWYTIHLQYIQP